MAILPAVVVSLLALLLVPTATLGAAPPPPSTADHAPAASRPLSPLAPIPASPISGGYGRIVVNSTDPNVVPNEGLRVNLTAFPSAVVGTGASFQASAAEGIGPYEAVFGLFENAQRSSTAFFSVFNKTTAVYLDYWDALGIVAGSSYDFELVHANGTRWALTVNGADFGGNATGATFDFGATAATVATDVEFSETAIYSNATPVPTVLRIPLAFAVLRSSGWYLPAPANEAWNGTSQTTPWGIQGRSELPTLAPGELVTGTSVTVLNTSAPEPVWTTGPVSVDVSLSPTLPPTQGTVPQVFNVTVVTPGGAPVPYASVYLSDSAGGTVLPPTVVTSPGGTAEALWQTPNVTRAETVDLKANVTLFGFVGASSMAVDLSPASQVIVAANPSSPTLRPNSQIALTLTTATTNGTPLVGTILAFSGPGVALLPATFAGTGSGGTVTVVVSAPPRDETLFLHVQVANAGEWGHLNLTVTVGAGPAGPSVATLAAEYGGVAAAVVLLGVLVTWIVRRRGPRRAIPSMGLAPVGQGRRERGEPDPTRTPPASGNP